METYKAKVTRMEVTVGDETIEVMDEAFCGNCGSVIYGYDEIICCVCESYIDFD